jgi:hypothetical protein
MNFHKERFNHFRINHKNLDDILFKYFENEFVSKHSLEGIWKELCNFLL